MQVNQIEIFASCAHNLNKLTIDRETSNLLTKSNILPPIQPEMTSPQENVYLRESAVERLQSRWSSSSRAIVDTPPSQPLNLQRLSGSPSSGSVKESHQKDPGAGDFRQRSAFGRPQGSNSKWTSDSGAITDSPPLQPLSGSRWNSGSQAAFDMASSQALVRHRMIVRPSSVSALNHSAAMKNHDNDIFETTIRTRCILNLSRMHLAPHCIASRSA
jgi:hypothetical protein